MSDPAPSYRSEFMRSPHHIVLALCTLGVGFMTGELLPLIIGATLYTIGWVYLPDEGFFHRWVDRRREAAQRAIDAQKVAEFVTRRDTLLSSLSSTRREQYSRLAAVCRDIESASADNPLASADPATDPRLRKLDELMWTYLRLLGIEQSLETFLETERRENVPELLHDAEAEIARLKTEIEAMKAAGPSPAFDNRQRFFGSRLERCEVLRKRQQRIQQAEENLALVRSEQERLDQQIKLIRADAVATKNAEALTARIDATVEHLDQTNKWLAELDEFKDLVADMPATELRVGYSVAPPPIAAQPEQAAPKPRAMVRQK